jgi:hypothetical protein
VLCSALLLGFVALLAVPLLYSLFSAALLYCSACFLLAVKEKLLMLVYRCYYSLWFFFFDAIFGCCDCCFALVEA